MGSQKALNDMANEEVRDLQQARKKRGGIPETTTSVDDPMERARKIVEENPPAAAPASALIEAAHDGVKPLDESQLGGVIMTPEMEEMMNKKEKLLVQESNRALSKE